jgi:hypothetical protein
MNRKRRYMQDAVIVMAILVVILALWRLQTYRKSRGGLGDWAATNIFGAATLGMIPRTGQGGGESPPPLEPISSNYPSNLSYSPASNPPSARAIASGSSSTNPPSTNLVATIPLNTNGPVTVIAVAPADLVETPPGVAAATNVPEAAAIERRLGEVNAKGGDIQISLSWHNYNDLDLHCIDPAGVEIFSAIHISARTGGELDIDQNAHLPYNMCAGGEYLLALSAERPPGFIESLSFTIRRIVTSDATAFLVRTVVQGKTNYFRSTIIYRACAKGNRFATCATTRPTRTLRNAWCLCINQKRGSVILYNVLLCCLSD